jgi:hypothetical protein
MVRPARMESKTWEKVSRATKKGGGGRIYVLKIYEKGPFKIDIKAKRPDTPLVEGKKEKKWDQFDIFNVMAKFKISFQSIRPVVSTFVRPRPGKSFFCKTRARSN